MTSNPSPVKKPETQNQELVKRLRRVSDFYPIIGRAGENGYFVANFYMPKWFTKALAKKTYNSSNIKEGLTEELRRYTEAFTFYFSTGENTGEKYHAFAYPLFCECCGVHSIETSGMGGSTGIGIDFHEWTPGIDDNELHGHNVDTFAQAFVLYTAWARYFNLVHSLLGDTKV